MEVKLQVHTIDARGLKCPQPVIKLTIKAPQIPAGDVIEISGDCPTFEKDIQSWCSRMNKTILEVIDMGDNAKKVKIQF